MAQRKYINSKELTKKMRNKTGLSPEKNQQVIDVFIEMLLDNVVKGETVNVNGLGQFTRQERHNQVLNNPITGKKIESKSFAYLTFRSGSNVKKRFKEIEVEQEPEQSAASDLQSSEVKAEIKPEPAKAKAPKRTVRKKTDKEIESQEEPKKKATRKSAPKKRAAKKEVPAAESQAEALDKQPVSEVNQEKKVATQPKSVSKKITSKVTASPAAKKSKYTTTQPAQKKSALTKSPKIESKAKEKAQDKPLAHVSLQSSKPPKVMSARDKLKSMSKSKSGLSKLEPLKINLGKDE